MDFMFILGFSMARAMGPEGTVPLETHLLIGEEAANRSHVWDMDSRFWNVCSQLEDPWRPTRKKSRLKDQ